MAANQVTFPVIGFLGAGRMATALAKGFVQSGLVLAEQVLASDVSPDSLSNFQRSIPGSQTVSSNQELADRAALLVLAIKPQFAPGALQAVRLGQEETVILSVMAGIQMLTLQKWLKTSRLIRCMPNTPSLIGAGAIGLAAHSTVAPEILRQVETLLGSVGLVIRTTERQLDAVTGLSGSGPAYVFSFIRGLINGGVQAGLPPETARELALQTVVGAVEMLRKTSASPQSLIEQVTSPGGTTLRGLEVLAAGGFEELVANCVLAATSRAEELGRTAD